MKSLGDRQAATKFKILRDRQSCDSDSCRI